jgi:hypothetical protein
VGKKTVRKPELRENASNTKKYKRLQQDPGKKVYIMLFIGHAITIINLPNSPPFHPAARQKKHPPKKRHRSPQIRRFEALCFVALDLPVDMQTTAKGHALLSINRYYRAGCCGAGPQ